MAPKSACKPALGNSVISRVFLIQNKEKSRSRFSESFSRGNNLPHTRINIAAIIIALAICICHTKPIFMKQLLKDSSRFDNSPERNSLRLIDKTEVHH